MSAVVEPQPKPTGNGEDVHEALEYDIQCLIQGVDPKIPEQLMATLTLACEAKATLAYTEDQPSHVVLKDVLADLSDRIDVGEQKYGTRLKTNNGRDPILDAYQKLLDASHYLKQAQIEGKLR